MQLLRLVTSAVPLCCALAASPAPPASASRPHIVRLTTTPALYPAYAAGVHDYVVRCSPAKPVRITTWAAAGTTPSIDGKPGNSATVALTAGQAVTIEDRAAAGTTAYHVRCLPPDFPTWTETRSGVTGAWYIATPTLSLGAARAHYVVIFDGHGVPVWWYRTPRVPIDAKLLPGPAVAFSSYPAAAASYEVRRLDGALERRIVSPDGRADDHELQRSANGDYVFLVYRPKQGVDLAPFGGPAQGTVLEGEIEEVSPTGKLVWSWSTDGHVDLSETTRWTSTIVGKPVALKDGVQAYDFFHANAVSLNGDVVVLSLRQTDGVYAIDRSTGRILWKLGGTPTPESLTVVGDPLAAAPLGGQHDARLLPDGTVTVFDDGTLLGRAPRAVRYRIDATARTATMVEQMTDPTVTGSLCCGSARLLANGNWVVSWGGDNVIGEYRADGTPVFRMTFDGLFSYRVVPVVRSRLSAAALRAGMDAMARR